MQATGDLDWGIAAVNLRASEAGQFSASQQASDGYLLKTTAADGSFETRLVRSHCLFVDWSKNAIEAEGLISLPSVHGVSVTVTESGYYLRADRTLNLDDPVIAEEIAGGKIKSVYGFLARSLKQRSESIDQPVNILCCDNIRANGKMLKQNFLSYLDHIGDVCLGRWVQRNAAFPCSMVDRITPRASAELIAEVSALDLSSELSPIHSEAFRQWVLEDSFSAPIPALRQAGVEIVKDVDPYEEAKIRILNGGHTSLCYLGVLAGHTTFDQAIGNPQLRSFFDAFEREEVLPGLNLGLPFDKLDYLEKITARFTNVAIADQLERICMDGYSKFPIYIRPTLQSCLSQGIAPKHGYLCIASWYVFARRFASGQISSHYHEPYWDQLEPMLAVGLEGSFARCKSLWGDLANQYPEFGDGIVEAIQSVEKQWPV